MNESGKLGYYDVHRVTVTLSEYRCTSPCSRIELETEADRGREGESEVVKCPHTHAAAAAVAVAALFAPPPGRLRHARMYGPRTGTEKSSGLGIIEALANSAGTNFTKPRKSQSCLLGTPLYIACAQTARVISIDNARLDEIWSTTNGTRPNANISHRD